MSLLSSSALTSSLRHGCYALAALVSLSASHAHAIDYTSDTSNVDQVDLLGQNLNVSTGVTVTGDAASERMFIISGGNSYGNIITNEGTITHANLAGSIFFNRQFRH